MAIDGNYQYPTAGAQGRTLTTDSSRGIIGVVDGLVQRKELSDAEVTRTFD